MNNKLEYFSGAFPDASLCKITFAIKSPRESTETIIDDNIIKIIKSICIGKIIKNDFEHNLDFDSRNEVVDFIKKNSNHYFESFDSTRDAFCLDFTVELYYANVRQFSKELKKKIKSGYIQTFFTRINF